MRQIYPQPGYSSVDVTNALASGQFVYADTYTFFPKVGSPLRYTSSQQDISVVPVGEGSIQTFVSKSVLISGLRVKTSLGIEVDEQEIKLDYPDGPLYQSALSWAQALLQGRLDGATVRRDRYIALQFPGPWLGGSPMFNGLISSLSKVGRQSATVQVKSSLVLLNRQAPAFLWEPTCKNTWGDLACGVDQSLWATAGTVGASPSRTVLPWTAATTLYNQGKVHIDNGDGVTRVRTIAKATTTNLYLAYPLDFDPLAGLSFTAYPGCSRTKDATTGCPRYHVNWERKFKGFPFVPVAEAGI